MEFYDAHIHFSFTSSPEELKEIFPRLIKTGLGGFDALFFAEFPRDMEKVLKMIPAFVHGSVSIPALELQEDPFPYFKWAEPLKIIPFADARFIEQDVEEKMPDSNKKVSDALIGNHAQVESAWKGDRTEKGKKPLASSRRR